MITASRKTRIIDLLKSGMSIVKVCSVEQLDYDLVHALKRLYVGKKRPRNKFRCVGAALRTVKSVGEIATECECTRAYVYFVKNRKRQRVEEQEDVCEVEE